MSKQKPAVSESPLKQNRIVPLDKLMEHPRNYRVHPKAQIDKLVLSLQRFGQGRSIVCQDGPDKLVIVAGHGVFEAATALQWKELRADILPAEWSDAQIEGYLIADNQHSQEASENEELLAMLLTEQKDAGFDLASLGSDDEMLRQMLESLGDGYLGGGEQEEGAGGDEFDTTPEEGPTRTQVGDIWKLGERHRLICGDSTNPEIVARLMQGERAQAVVTDPPFAVRQDKWDTFKSAEDFANFTGKWLKLAYAYADVVACFFADRWLPLLRGVAEAIEVPYRRALIWRKPPGSQFAGASLDGFWFDFEIIQVFGHPNFKADKHTKMAVLEYRTVTGQEHGCEKPVDLLKDIIEGYTEPRALLYEPFSGTGTTMIAAHRAGRRVYGCEISPKFCDIVLKRYEAETNEQAQLLERVEVPAHA